MRRLPEVICEELRRKRIEKGLTFQALAEKIGVSKQTVRTWELGQVPSSSNLMRYLMALGVSAKLKSQIIREVM